MRITMIGTGYVGLVSGACFSEFGVDVTCVDKDESKIIGLNNGIIPIFEPGLERLVESNVKSGRLHFTTDTAAAVVEADVVFIAVGTPERRGDGAADLSYVYEAARDIARSLKKFTVIVTKSTVPVGTGAEVERIIRATNPAAEFAVASNPEFLREGSAIGDFMRPDRVVVGSESPRAIEILKELYRPLYLIETPFVITNLATSELTKYASNAFLATKITFINEIANLCEAVGADVHAVAKGMGLDGRIGRKFLHPGPGYGGSCFPKDTLALVRTARDANSPISVVETVVEANKKQKMRMVSKIEQAMDDGLQGKVIAILGLTFKPNTDDMRDSASLTVIPELVQRGAKVRAYDPEGMKETRRYLPEEMVAFAQDAYDACSGVDAVVILCEWNQFRNMNFAKIKAKMRPQKDGTFLFCDLRNIYEPQAMRAAGFRYVCVGR